MDLMHGQRFHSSEAESAAFGNYRCVCVLMSYEPHNYVAMSCRHARHSCVGSRLLHSREALLHSNCEMMAIKQHPSLIPYAIGTVVVVVVVAVAAIEATTAQEPMTMAAQLVPKREISSSLLAGQEIDAVAKWEFNVVGNGCTIIIFPARKMACLKVPPSWAGRREGGRRRGPPPLIENAIKDKDGPQFKDVWQPQITVVCATKKGRERKQFCMCSSYPFPPCG